MRTLGIAAVVMAAGFSRRLGRPKQMEILAGETLLTRAVRTAQEALLEPVFAVIPPSFPLVDLPVHARYLENPQAAEGMASSVRIGVAAAAQAGVRGVVLMTCDQPLLTSGHLRALCAAPERVMASGYAGRAGVPAYFPQESFPALLALAGDAGARALLQTATQLHNEDLALDIDAEADVREMQRRFKPS